MRETSQTKFLTYNLIIMKRVIVASLLGVLLVSWVYGNEKTYDTQEEFLAAEGSICEIATDGINTIHIVDWEFGASTMAYVENPVYSCEKYIDDIMTYDTEEAFLQAEGNICKIATDGGNIIHMASGEFGISTKMYVENPEYSCTEYKLSNNDRKFYKSAQAQLDSKFVEKLDTVISRYDSKMKMLRWSDERRKEAHEALIERVETMISDLLLSYPQDIALPEKANNTYLKLTLIKFELMLLDM